MSEPVKTTVVVLAKYWEVFKGFLDTVEYHLPNYDKILVRDVESDIPTDTLGGRWKVVDGMSPFSMAGNGNIALKAVTEGDILYCGDDVRFMKADTISKLQEIAYKDSAIGILSPRIIGRGSPSQVTPMAEISEVPPLEMWFPCIYLKRETIDKVGYLDEQFSNFGSDDLDYCIRTKLEGMKLCVTNKAVVKHEASPEGGPTTFVKKIGASEWQKQQGEALSKLLKKYDTSANVMDKVIKGADVKMLLSRPTDFRKRVTDGFQPSEEECIEFWKTRHIFIGTPAYGGMFHINYVNSLLSLRDWCHKYGVDCTTNFMYNESLVTRARNKIADEFMNKPEATDFFWIDADIGFSPQDILTMTLYDEDVISFPCVRKNLRLERVLAAGKKDYAKEFSDAFTANPGKSWSEDELKQVMGKAQYKNGHSQDQLEGMLGEIVLNFPPGKVPPGINLGRMLEVQDGGSGLMRIKRETFNKVMETFPNRWAYQLAGESGGRKPVYMFFQAEPDYTVEGQDLPDYISEDYSFCRLVRKAGMHVWVAPWCQTTHAGTYLFQGNPQLISQSGGFLR